LHTTTRESALTHNQPLFTLLSDRPKGATKEPDAADTTGMASVPTSSSAAQPPVGSNSPQVPELSNGVSHAATREGSITQTQLLFSSTPTGQTQSSESGVGVEEKESGPDTESVSSSLPASRQAAFAAELRMARLQLKRKDIGKKETMVTNRRIRELEELLQAA
jgi:hypothetical protein